LELNASELRKHSETACQEIAAALDRLAAAAETHYQDLEDLERRLTALEDKMIAATRALQTEEQLLAARRDLDFQLRPYRGKMTADQLSMLEKQFLERRLLESASLPRLSLFYMR
jgi:autotransporter translocation and assembly factor TamB